MPGAFFIFLAIFSSHPPLFSEGYTLGIIVLDFGGQYAHLIANRIRRLHVFAEIRSPNSDVADLADAEGLILSGGPSSVYDADAPTYNPEILEMDKPMLGLCYGHQLLCHRLGGQVEPGNAHEFGAAYLQVKEAKGVLLGLDEREMVWMSHRDQVTALPPGFEILAGTEDCPIAAMGHAERKIYGLQFHPEVTHSVRGMEILDNFVALTGAARDWTMEQYIEWTMERVREQTKGRKVFLLVSGGVDSSVAQRLNLPASVGVQNTETAFEGSSSTNQESVVLAFFSGRAGAVRRKMSEASRLIRGEGADRVEEMIGPQSSRLLRRLADVGWNDEDPPFLGIKVNVSPSVVGRVLGWFDQSSDGGRDEQISLGPADLPPETVADPGFGSVRFLWWSDAPHHGQGSAVALSSDQGWLGRFDEPHLVDLVP